jgi:hypothetical protein
MDQDFKFRPSSPIIPSISLTKSNIVISSSPQSSSSAKTITAILFQRITKPKVTNNNKKTKISTRAPLNNLFHNSADESSITPLNTNVDQTEYLNEKRFYYNNNHENYDRDDIPAAFNKNHQNLYQKEEVEEGRKNGAEGCFKSLNYANLNASYDMIIRVNCSNFKKNYSEYTQGSVWLKCGYDGLFTKLNSSCSYSRSYFLHDLQKRLKNRQNSFAVFEKINNELNNYLKENGSITELIILLKNASETLHVDTITSKTSNLNVSNVIN